MNYVGKDIKIFSGNFTGSAWFHSLCGRWREVARDMRGTQCPVNGAYDSLKNERRRKQATSQASKKAIISSSTREPMEKFFGAAGFTTDLCCIFTLFMLTYPAGCAKQDAANQILWSLPTLWGVFIYFVRRPRLSVEKQAYPSRCRFREMPQ